MGGSVPIGYANQNKKLVIVPDEAKTVRWIFQKYLELGAIGPLLKELHRRGLKTKPRSLSTGQVVGGARFSKGGLNHLLKNRCYIGELVHRAEIHAADLRPSWTEACLRLCRRKWRPITSRRSTGSAVRRTC
jgi:site-specific DNA recombinase